MEKNKDNSKRIVTDKQRDGQSYIKNRIDYYCGQYVTTKSGIVKAKSYYNGKRSEKDFFFIEDNYGLGNPHELKFSPTTSNRIDILCGLMTSQDLKSQVTAIDKDTVNKEDVDIIKRKQQAKVDIVNDISKNPELKEQKEIQEELEKRFAELEDQDFISGYQKAGQDIIDFFLNSHSYNIASFREEMFLELLNAGEMIYKENEIIKGEYPTNQKLESEDVHFLLKKGSKDISSSDAIVHRMYMTKRQVMMELGHHMTNSQKKDFLQDTSVNYSKGIDIPYYNYLNSEENTRMNMSEGLYNETYQYLSDVVEVLHVEYKETKEIEYNLISFKDKIVNLVNGKKDKKKKLSKEFRYSGYRLGNKYYIDLGLDKNAKRNLLNNRKVEFTYKGISFNKYGQNPNSISYKLIDIQDMYDLMIFHRNNMIAVSGNKGSRIPITAIPSYLGTKMTDRVNKFKALSKEGIQLFDPTQVGAEAFSYYGEYDGSVSGQGINAINAIIMQLEAQADAAAGINPTMRGIVEQREAVSNVKTGITMVSYATKKYFNALDHLFESSMMSLLDDLKISFPNGFHGAYYKAANKVAFNIAPEYYRSSLFLVSIKRDDTDTIQLEKFKGIVNELVGGGMLKAGDMIKAQAATSKQEVENIAIKGVEKAEKEHDIIKQQQEQMKQMNAQLEQASKQMEEMTKKIKNLEKSDRDIELKKLALKEKEIDSKASLEREKQADTKIIEEKKIEEISKRTNLEREQIIAGGDAVEVRNLN